MVFSEFGFFTKVGGKSLKERNFRKAAKRFLHALERDFEANRVLTKKEMKKLQFDVQKEFVKDIESKSQYLKPIGLATYDKFGQFHTLTMNEQVRLVVNRASNKGPSELYPDKLLTKIGRVESCKASPGLINTIGVLLKINSDGNVVPFITNTIKTVGISVGSLAVGIGTAVAAFEIYDLVNKTTNERNNYVEFLSEIAVKVEKNLQLYPGLLEFK